MVSIITQMYIFFHIFYLYGQIAGDEKLLCLPSAALLEVKGHQKEKEEVFNKVGMGIQVKRNKTSKTIAES